MIVNCRRSTLVASPSTADPTLSPGLTRAPQLPQNFIPAGISKLQDAHFIIVALAPHSARLILELGGAHTRTNTNMYNVVPVYLPASLSGGYIDGHRTRRDGRFRTTIEASDA